MLLVQYTGDDNFFAATGFRFSDNHILTSAHVLVDRLKVGKSAVLRGAERIIFIPGLSGMPSSLSPDDPSSVPFGIYEIHKRDPGGKVNFKVPQEYLDQKKSPLPRVREDATQFDYGLIDISRRETLVSGKLPKGNWDASKRSQAITVAADTKNSDEILRMLLKARNEGKGINLSGYPGDKPCSQWKSLNGKIIRLAKKKTAKHNELQHMADTAPGMSGCPVWLFQESRPEPDRLGVKYTLIGINSACAPFGTDVDKSGGREQKVLFNRVTLITPEVLKRLREPSLLVRVP